MVINEDGFLIPARLRDYEEKAYLGGLIKLRKFNRVDLLYGYVEDQERDLIYMHLLVLFLTLLIFLFCLMTAKQ